MFKQKGFTLIEVMIVVAIIAVLLAVAFPSYQDYIRTTRRSVGKAELMEVLARQEQFFTDNKQYANGLFSLGYVASPYGVDENGDSVAADSPDRIYLIQFAPGTTTKTSFKLEAIPQFDQAKDTKCGTLSITNLGVKTVSGTLTVDDCW